jgi:hypothetical protein
MDNNERADQPVPKVDSKRRTPITDLLDPDILNSGWVCSDPSVKFFTPRFKPVDFSYSYQRVVIPDKLVVTRQGDIRYTRQ